MPLSVPNLDDRTFDDLVAEAIPMVTRYAPQWTNHNASDPGITLVELLAYVSEMLIYRLNRVTRNTKLKFLQLLLGATPADVEYLMSKPMEEIDKALGQAVRELQQLQRSVTDQDYEKLIPKLSQAPDQPGVARARCFSGLNLEASGIDSPMRDCPGHVSVVIVPDEKLGENQVANLLNDLREKLEPMRLLTTRLHLVRPFYLWLSLGAVIKINPDADIDEVRRKAIGKIEKFFEPSPDSELQHEGWPFGRPVYLSEVYAQLEEVAGVDFIEDVRVLHLSEKPAALDEAHSAVGIQVGVPAASTVGINTRLGGAAGNGQRLIRDARGTLIAVTLRPYELVKVVIHKSHLLDYQETVRPLDYT